MPRASQQVEMDGEELRAIRKRLDLTQKGFAELLGCHRITISDYERGAEPIPATKARLARTLDRRHQYL